LIRKIHRHINLIKRVIKNIISFKGSFISSSHNIKILQICNHLSQLSNTCVIFLRHHWVLIWISYHIIQFLQSIINRIGVISISILVFVMRDIEIWYRGSLLELLSDFVRLISRIYTNIWDIMFPNSKWGNTASLFGAFRLLESHWIISALSSTYSTLARPSWTEPTTTLTTRVERLLLALVMFLKLNFFTRLLYLYELFKDLCFSLLSIYV